MTTNKNEHKTIWIKVETHQGLVDATKGKESFDATISRVLKVYWSAIECGLVE